MTETKETTDSRIRPVQRASDIADFEFGQIGNVLITPNRASGRVLVMFNGAIPRDKLRNDPFFQRWTWSHLFDATVIFVSDPSVSIASDIRLGWYVGKKKGWSLKTLLETVRRHIDDLHAKPEVVCFGSSGGGFAAIQAALHGWCDRAIAINPQTNVLEFAPQFVRRIRDYYESETGQFEAADMDRVSLLEHIKRRGKLPVPVQIFQNYYDREHYEKHLLPLLDLVSTLPEASRYRLEVSLFLERALEHSPPSRELTMRMIHEAAPHVVNGRGQRLIAKFNAEAAASQDTVPVESDE